MVAILLDRPWQNFPIGNNDYGSDLCIFTFGDSQLIYDLLWLTITIMTGSDSDGLHYDSLL